MISTYPQEPNLSNEGRVGFQAAGLRYNDIVDESLISSEADFDDDDNTQQNNPSRFLFVCSLGI